MSGSNVGTGYCGLKFHRNISGKATSPEPVTGDQNIDEALAWEKIIEAGAMMGQRPDQTLRQTLPELKLAMRGWQRAHGLDPDDHQTNHPMTHDRLIELARRYDRNDN